MKHVEMIIDYVVDGDDFQYSDNHGVLIRCKDCKYHDERYRRISVKWLPCMEIRTDGNWFCASAERREE